MRHISVYLFLMFIIFTSCVKEEVIPVAGMWASVNEDKSVAKLIEFSNGAFIEYTPKNDTKFYYHDEKVWNATKEDFDVIKYPYSIEDQKLILDDSKTQATIYFGDNQLNIDGTLFYSVFRLESEYGSKIIHDACTNGEYYIEYLPYSQDVVSNYKITNIPVGSHLSVTSDVDWINSIIITDKQFRFHVEENFTSEKRSGYITLSHPAADSIQMKVSQLVSSPELSSYETITNYAASEHEFAYHIENPRHGEQIKITCDDPWIEEIIDEGNKVSFKVLENNSGYSRVGSIKLIYGAVNISHVIRQSYSSSEIVLDADNVVCDYTQSLQYFSYDIVNPREGVCVDVMCSASWISDLNISNDQISYVVHENNEDAPRSAEIIIIYGSVQIIYNVTQGFLVNLSSHSSANSYIISDAGAYKFKTVYGCSNNSIDNIKSVSVLWESFGTDVIPNVCDLIKDISYSEGYITFKTANLFKEGNALIIAQDAIGQILWSWHIWLTDKPQGQVYYNNAGTMMDRNLGATSALPSDGILTHGLLYQWGRKDPFLSLSSISLYTTAKSTINWPTPVESDTYTGTIEYTIANPTTLVSLDFDWFDDENSAIYNNLWITSEGEKTIYDPCPPGWKVPYKSVWAVALGSSAYMSNYRFDSYNHGMDFSGTLGADRIIWYPSVGYLEHVIAFHEYGGSHGRFWTVSPSTEVTKNRAYCFCLFNEGWYNPGDGYEHKYIGFVHPTYSELRSYGCSVRCMKE